MLQEPSSEHGAKLQFISADGINRVPVRKITPSITPRITPPMTPRITPPISPEHTKPFDDPWSSPPLTPGHCSISPAVALMKGFQSLRYVLCNSCIIPSGP